MVSVDIEAIVRRLNRCGNSHGRAARIASRISRRLIQAAHQEGGIAEATSHSLLEALVGDLLERVSLLREFVGIHLLHHIQVACGGGSEQGRVWTLALSGPVRWPSACSIRRLRR